MGNNKSSIESLCFSDEEQCVVSGAMSGSIKVFDLNVGKLVRSLRGHQVNTCTLDYHPYGEFIVSGSSDTSMKVWDVRQKTCIQTYSGHEKEVTCVRFSPDGRWVASEDLAAAVGLAQRPTAEAIFAGAEPRLSRHIVSGGQGRRPRAPVGWRAPGD